MEMLARGLSRYLLEADQVAQPGSHLAAVEAGLAIGDVTSEPPPKWQPPNGANLIRCRPDDYIGVSGCRQSTCALSRLRSVGAHLGLTPRKW